MKELPAQSEIEQGDGTVDRDHPLNCPIQLERIVSRTDITRFDYVGSEDQQQAYQSYLRELVTNNLYPDIEQSYVNSGVAAFLDQITSEVGTKVIGDVDLSLKFITFQNEVKAHSSEIVAKLRQQCLDYSIAKCVLSPDIERQMSDWVGTTANLTFSSGAVQADRFYLHSRLANAEQTENLPIDYPVDEYGGLSIIGFGNSESAGDINQLSSLSLKFNDNAEPLEIHFDEPVSIFKGMNRKQTLVCNPVASLHLADVVTTDVCTVMFDLQQIMQQGSMWAQFSSLVAEVLTEQGYGSLIETSFPLNLPDLSQSGNLTWTATITSALDAD